MHDQLSQLLLSSPPLFVLVPLDKISLTRSVKNQSIISSSSNRQRVEKISDASAVSDFDSGLIKLLTVFNSEKFYCLKFPVFHHDNFDIDNCRNDQYRLRGF